MSAAITDLGLIIHQNHFGEADKFIKIYTPKHGLIEVVAKGARRLTSKKSPHLDNLNLIKFQTSRGKVPQFLLQVETINSFTGIKTDFKKTRTCFYITEILHLTLTEAEADPRLFSTLIEFLTRLDLTEAPYRSLAVEFQHFLINRLGFALPSDSHPQALINCFESIVDRPLASRLLK